MRTPVGDPTLDASGADVVIEEYLGALRAQMTASSDADRVLEEIRDHLWDDVLTRPDVADATAARAAIARCGDVDAIGPALSTEAELRTLARMTTRFTRWSVVVGVAVAVAVRATIAVDGRGRIGAIDTLALTTAALAALSAASLSMWSSHSAHRLTIDGGTARRVLEASVGCAMCIGAAIATVTALSGDLVADSIRGTSTIAQLAAVGVAIVLAAAVANGLRSLRHLWHSFALVPRTSPVH